MNRISSVVARAGVRSFQSSARSRAVSMKEPYGAMGDGSKGGIIPASEGYQNIAKLQKLWSVDDGTMVWQKRSSDKSMFMFTMALCGSAVAYCFFLIGSMSFPKKPE